MKKKILSLILTAIMSFSILPGRQALGAAEQIQGWTTAASGEGECKLTDVSPCFGEKSLSLVNKTASDSASASTQISVKAGETYRFSFWTKGNALATANAVAGSAKINLASKYKSYYWTNTEYEFTATENSNNFKIGFELSKGGSLYVDGISVINIKQRSKNLVSNSDFEYKEVKDEKTEFLSGMSLPIEEELASFGEKNVMPMLFMDDFELDGNLTEWEGYASATMPNANTLISDMKNYGGDDDLFAKIMLSYDETNFYLAAAITDDTFDNPNVDSNYWKGDSLQLAIGTVEEDFGVEIGLYQNNQGTTGVYSSELIKDAWGTIDEKTMYLRENSKVVVKRSGNITYYEAQLPWLFRFDSVPDECLINVLVNDADGSGRKGFFEMQPGIGYMKSNEKFVFGTPIENTGDVFGYIDGPKWLYQGEPGSYSLYIANSSEKSEIVNITLPDGSETSANVPAKKVYKYDYNAMSDDIGIVSDEIKLKCSNVEFTVKKNIQIKRDLLKAFTYIETELLPELKELEAKCLEKGINPVYEQSDISTITNYIEYGREDVAAVRDSRAEYVYNELIEMYEVVKKDLTAYLDGSKVPFTTYLYKGDEIKLDGMSYTTKMQNTKTGEMEERPAYFIGFNIGESGSKLDKTYEDISAIGGNLVQNEIVMSQYIKKAGNSVRGWSTLFNGAIDATIEYDSTEAQSGDYSLKITNNTPIKANTYVVFSKNVGLKKDKTYVLSFWAKASNATGCILRPNGWSSGTISLNGTYDWKKFTYEYKPTVDVTKEILFLCENVTTSLNIDNVRLVEKGTNKNMLSHGSFEEQPVIINGYAFDQDRLNSVLIPALDRAHKNNVQMDLLLGIHYFPTNVVDNWQLGRAVSYQGFNVANSEVLAAIEAFVTGILNGVKDHPAVHSVCTANEPKYSVGREENVPLFKDEWISYIKKIYNNDIKLLNEAYTTEYTSFEEVPLTNKNINEVMYYDYLNFNSEVWTGWHEWVTGIVKKVAPEVNVHAKIMEVVQPAESNDAQTGEPLFARGIDPEWFGQFSDLSGCDASNFIQRGKDGEELVKKEMWYDLLSSFSGKPVFNSEDHIIVDGDEIYTPDYASFVSADLWQGIIHNRSDSTIWIWTRTTALNNHISGNINHRPDALSADSRMILDVNRLSKEISAIQKKPASVGMLYSLQSRIYEYSNAHMNTMMEAYRALTFAGEKTKFFTENMIETNGIDESIKLLIIGNAQSTNAATIKGIKSFIERGGKVMVIGDVFKYDNRKKPLSNPEDVQFVLDNSVIVPSHNEERYVKFDFDFYEYMANYLKEIGIRNIELIDTKTGKQLTNTEYQSTSFDGKTIINICNMDLNIDKEFKVLIDGKEPENMTELRTGEKVSGAISLPDYTPLLIRID